MFKATSLKQYFTFLRWLAASLATDTVLARLIDCRTVFEEETRRRRLLEGEP